MNVASRRGGFKDGEREIERASERAIETKIDKTKIGAVQNCADLLDLEEFL